MPFGFYLIMAAQFFSALADNTLLIVAIAALREMQRVARPGGTIAVLENDIFHHVLLPWPVDLEVPIQRAIQLASRERFGSSTKLAPARRFSRAS